MWIETERPLSEVCHKSPTNFSKHHRDDTAARTARAEVDDDHIPILAQGLPNIAHFRNQVQPPDYDKYLLYISRRVNSKGGARSKDLGNNPHISFNSS